MLYDKVLERIIKNKEIKHTGKYNGVPYPFPKLNDYLVSIDRGQAIGILGATGTGKSKIARYTYLYHCYSFYKQTGYDLRIILFAMEDSKERVYDFVLCHYLKEHHNITISSKELNSKTRELPDFILDAIVKASDYFEEMEKIVTFIDGVTEPTEMFKICTNIARKLGRVEKYHETIEGEKVEQSRYISDTHVIAIFDNMSNIDTEEDANNEQLAILKFVKDYMRLKLCNYFNWTCVMVMQMDFESERQSFNKQGETVIAKIEPGVHSIGDSKRASRSFHLIFGMFAPDRYDLIRYPIPPKSRPQATYNIEILGNRFRSLRVVKSNDSDTGMRVGLLFDAMGEKFEELPAPDDPAMSKYYQQITGAGSKYTKSTNIIFKEDEEEAPF